MAKPLKFYQTLNQAPRSAKNYGKHRRAGTPAHGHSTDGACDGPGGSGTWTTVNFTTSNSWVAWDFAAPEPKPPTLPYAGIRTGELIGHRLWWVIGGQLCSLAHRRLWLPGETIAGDINKSVDSSFFGPTIWGGTYSFLNREQCDSEIENIKSTAAEFDRLTANGHIFYGGWMPYSETRTLVVGTIKVWGEVIEHKLGYRAEFAKLNSIDAIHGPGDLNALRERYGTR